MQGRFVTFAFRYAARSLWRNKRRTVLTIGTVTLSVVVSLVATRYSTAVLKIWENGSIDHGTSHAQLHVQGYYDRPDVLTETITFPDGHDIEKRLGSDGSVLAVGKRLVFEGIISSGTKTIYFLGRAVSPEAELVVSPELFHPGVDQGKFVASDAPSGVTIGKGLAETLGLKLGDEATIMAHTLTGAVNGIDVLVTGIIDFPVPAMSKRLVYMNLAQAQKGLKIPGRYSELAVRLKPGVDPGPWVEALRADAENAKLDLRGWWQIDPVIVKVKEIWDSVVGVIIVLLFVSAAISVLNIVFMLVAERTVEIGTLMAIGARPRDIRTLFTLEASLIGAIGGAIGAVLGNLALLAMDLVGVPFDSPFSGGVLLVHPKVSVVATLAVGAVAILICYVSALAPARKAAYVEPVVAFRGQIT